MKSSFMGISLFSLHTFTLALKSISSDTTRLIANSQCTFAYNERCFDVWDTTMNTHAHAQTQAHNKMILSGRMRGKTREIPQRNSLKSVSACDGQYTSRHICDLCTLYSWNLMFDVYWGALGINSHYDPLCVYETVSILILKWFI